MLEFILYYKWLLLGTIEIGSWISTVLMFLFLFKYKKKVIAYLFGVIALIAGWGPDIALGIYNYIVYSKFDLFSVTVIVLFIYNFIWGKKHYEKIKKYFQEKYETNKSV